jgi:hypothetical protein
MAHKPGKPHTTLKHHGAHHGPHHKGGPGGFSKGGAHVKHGHHGTMLHGKAKGGGHLVTTPANVGSLGHKA